MYFQLQVGDTITEHHNYLPQGFWDEKILIFGFDEDGNILIFDYRPNITKTELDDFKTLPISFYKIKTPEEWSALAFNGAIKGTVIVQAEQLPPHVYETLCSRLECGDVFATIILCDSAQNKIKSIRFNGISTEAKMEILHTLEFQKKNNISLQKIRLIAQNSIFRYSDDMLLEKAIPLGESIKGMTTNSFVVC